MKNYQKCDLIKTISLKITEKRGVSGSRCQDADPRIRIQKLIPFRNTGFSAWAMTQAKKHSNDWQSRNCLGSGGRAWRRSRQAASPPGSYYGRSTVIIINDYMYFCLKYLWIGIKKKTNVTPSHTRGIIISVVDSKSFFSASGYDYTFLSTPAPNSGYF